MKFNKTDASKLAGITRSTLDNHIKKGKVSATKNARGHFEIEISELERVYGKLNSLDNKDTSKSVRIKQPKTPIQGSVLQVEIDLLREQLNREKETVTDLRNRLDSSEDERRKKDNQLTALLTDQSNKGHISAVEGFKNFFGGITAKK